MPQHVQDAPMGLAPERRDLMTRAVDAATAPGGRLMLVGEPGIGKSHFIDAVRQRLESHRTVLFVRPNEGDRQPFAGLRDLLAAVPDAVFRQLEHGKREAVLAVLGDDPGRNINPVMVQAAVTQVLAMVAKGGATLVIDEWQWLDPESRRTMERAFLRQGVGSTLALVAARRADGSPEDIAVRPLFAPTDVTALVPLAPASVLRVVADAGIGDLAASTLAEVAEASGGNPLWAIELATARAEGDLRRWASGSVVEAVAHRVASLPETVRAVLQLVAVLGSAEIDDLALVCPSAAKAVADGAARRVFRYDAGRAAAAHPLLAAAALQALSAEEERALHATIAELPLPASQRLEHRDAGTPPGPDERLAQALTEAAARARRAGATETALRLARRSLARTDHALPSRATRVTDAAELAFAVGDAALALEVIAELDIEMLAVPTYDQAIAVLVLALDRTEGSGAVARRLNALQQVTQVGGDRWNILETWRTAALFGHDDDAIERLINLKDLLPSDDAPWARRTALSWAAYFRLDRGEGVDDDLIAELRATERHSAVPALEDTADAIEALWPYQADDLARSRANLAAFVRAAKGAGEMYSIVQGLSHSAIVETLAGQLSVAKDLLNQSEREARSLTLLPPSLYRARGLVALAQDDREALDEFLLTPLSPAAEGRGALLRIGVSGLDNAYSERWDEALEDLDTAYSLARRHGINEPGKRLWIDVELVRALVRAGNLDRASTIIADLTELGRRPGRLHARGQALRLQALVANHLGDGERALQLSADGLTALRRSGFRSEVVRAMLEQVAILAKIGQVQRGLHILKEIAELAVRIGDPRLIARTESTRSRLNDADSRAALTPAEQRVAWAAAAGQTNREIAGDLFLSVRTVETHLAAVYRKLGFRSRTQLALNMHAVASPQPA
jgi:DNA-binding CsgD family transcriptional regulator/KaiC/GvpD/RAD55 family RecA-like ATPase